MAAGQLAAASRAPALPLAAAVAGRFFAFLPCPPGACSGSWSVTVVRGLRMNSAGGQRGQGQASGMCTPSQGSGGQMQLHCLLPGGAGARGRACTGGTARALSVKAARTPPAPAPASRPKGGAAGAGARHPAGRAPAAASGTTASPSVLALTRSSSLTTTRRAWAFCARERHGREGGRAVWQALPAAAQGGPGGAASSLQGSLSAPFDCACHNPGQAGQGSPAWSAEQLGGLPGLGVRHALKRGCCSRGARAARPSTHQGAPPHRVIHHKVKALVPHRAFVVGQG